MIYIDLPARLNLEDDSVVSQYAIVIEADGPANYSAYAPDLPGVVATGDTLEAAEAAMREAVEFHI